MYDHLKSDGKGFKEIIGMEEWIFVQTEPISIFSLETLHNFKLYYIID